MSLTTLINTPCTLVLSASSDDADDYGDITGGEPTLRETVCELQQRRRDEPGGQGEFSDTEWRVYFLPDEQGLDTADALIVEGARYEFVGDPWLAKVGTPAMHHIEATVRRTGSEEEGS